MLYAAIDIHEHVFEAAVLDPETGEVVEERFSADRESLARWAERWHGRVAAVAIEATTGCRWVWRELAGVLGMWFQEAEGAKFWMQVLTDHGHPVMYWRNPARSAALWRRRAWLRRSSQTVWLCIVYQAGLRLRSSRRSPNPCDWQQATSLRIV